MDIDDLSIDRQLAMDLNDPSVCRTVQGDTSEHKNKQTMDTSRTTSKEDDSLVGKDTGLKLPDCMDQGKLIHMVSTSHCNATIQEALQLGDRSEDEFASEQTFVRNSFVTGSIHTSDEE